MLTVTIINIYIYNLNTNYLSKRSNKDNVIDNNGRK